MGGVSGPARPPTGLVRVLVLVLVVVRGGSARAGVAPQQAAGAGSAGDTDLAPYFLPVIGE